MVVSHHLSARANELFGRYPDSIDEEEMVRLGVSFAEWVASERPDRIDPPRIAVGSDPRSSSLELRDALVRGLISARAHVVDVGLATPALVVFAMNHLRLEGALSLTGGERSLEWNGIRLYLRERALTQAETGRLAERAARLPAAGPLLVRGRATAFNMQPDYLRALERSVPSLPDRLRRKPISVVVAACHGPASFTAPQALARVGCRVVRLRCAPATLPCGSPSDPSDPSLIREVGFLVRASRADLGILFGWDGCRFRVVDAAGRAVETEHLYALLAADLCSRNPGARIACDMRMSDLVDEAVEASGGEVVLVPPGEGSLLEAARTRGAVLGGDHDGSVFFPHLSHRADDAVHASLRLVDLLAGKRGASGRLSLREHLPLSRFRSPERIGCGDLGRGSFRLLHTRFSDLKLRGEPILSIHLDPEFGLRVRAEDGWCVVHRLPGAEGLRMVHEGKTEQGFRKMGALLREAAQDLARVHGPGSGALKHAPRPSRGPSRASITRV